MTSVTVASEMTSQTTLFGCKMKDNAFIFTIKTSQKVEVKRYVVFGTWLRKAFKADVMRMTLQMSELLLLNCIS